MNLPKHIVIIPDGNRRWAKKRGLPPFFSHRHGAKTAEKIFRAALDLKIPYFTFWGSSLDNIVKRPAAEIDFLFKLFERYFKRSAKDKEIHSRQIKISALGRWEKLFPEKAKKAIREAIEKTKNYKNYHLTFLLAYSGVDEMTTAIQRIASILRTSDVPNIDDNFRTSDVQKLVKNNLWTKDLPPVDLVIRTGGEPHNSNGFMMWDTADSQLYFTETLWPEFSVEEFKKAISTYQKTERRLGK